MPPTRSSTTKVTPLLKYASPNPRDWRSFRGARERPVNLCVRDGFKAFEGPGLNSLRICESLREPLRSLQSVSAHTSDATSTSGDDSDDTRLGKQILSVYVTPGFTRILGNPPEFTRSTYAAGDGNHVPGIFTTLRCPVNSPPPILFGFRVHIGANGALGSLYSDVNLFTHASLPSSNVGLLGPVVPHLMSLPNLMGCRIVQPAQTALILPSS